MKHALIATLLCLFAATAHGEEHYIIQALITENGKLVGDYSTTVSNGATARFVSSEIRKFTDSYTYKDGVFQSKTEKPYETGSTLLGTPRTTTEGAILLEYSVTYSNIASVTNVPIEGTKDTYESPSIREREVKGEFLATSGSPEKMRLASPGSEFECTLTVTKI